MAQVTLITGGQRSGKSSYAQRLALSLSDRPIYLATSRVWDEEHRARIERHRADRDERWESIEQEKYLSSHDLTGRTVVVDCLTLWATNFFFDLEGEVDTALEAIKAELSKLLAQECTLLLITNELGMGGTSENDIQRRFTDLQGWMNQHIAQRADRVILMVSGLPVTIK